MASTMGSTARWSDKPLPVPKPSSLDSSIHELAGATAVRVPVGTAQPRPGMRQWLLGEGKKVAKQVRKEYGGGRGFNGQYTYFRPRKHLDADVEKEILFAGTARPSDAGKEKGKYPFLNSLRQTTWKLQDVETYLSSTSYQPRRLLVQAAPYVFKDPDLVNTDWRRRAISGDVPRALRMAEWALWPGDRDPETGKRSPLGVCVRMLRVLAVGLPLQVVLLIPTILGIGSDPWEDDADDSFLPFPGYHWQWPKHAVNPLDQQPQEDGMKKPTSKNIKLSTKSRLVRPRRLIVLRDDRWVLEEDPSPGLHYILISYRTFHFDIKTENGRRALEEMAAWATLRAGCSAYWLDHRCIASDKAQDEKTADINRICDVIRTAHQIVVMLPDQRGKPNSKPQHQLLQEWGDSMWTLPEGLLTPENIQFCYRTEQGSFNTFELEKLEMTDMVWRDATEDIDDPPTRVLAEHYTGTLVLSRLELFSAALAALCGRESSHTLYTDADLAYALMGLLHHRIEPDSTDDLFQALARLSLANDSDQLIERMICMYPKPYDKMHPRHASAFRRLFELLTKKDHFETHLWDIKPLCEIVGVGKEPTTVMINNCKAIPIRWKNFPRMKYARHEGLKKMFSSIFVRSGAWWFQTGVTLAIVYAPILLASVTSNLSRDQLDPNGPGYNSNLVKWLVAVFCAFVAVGIVLSAFGPPAVRRLFGGAVLRTSPHLVAFEGVMPIRDLERIVFGNVNNRLSYEPSSSPFILHHRNPERREGMEPSWITDSPGQPDLPIPAGHRLFTLVDTNNLGVTIFTALRPPTVALICGREGGMLRTVLCSWRFSMDCLFREAVVRLPNDTFDIAKTPNWLKLSLGNQEEMKESIRWQSNEGWRKRQSVATVSKLSPKSKPHAFQKPPASVSGPRVQAQAQSPPTAHAPQHQSENYVSPPISAYSPQARHRVSSGSRPCVPRHYSAQLPPRGSPLKSGASVNTDGAPPQILHHPTTQPPQATVTTSYSPNFGNDQPFFTPPSSTEPYHPPTFLAPITPIAPLSSPSSPHRAASPNPDYHTPTDHARPLPLPSPPVPGARPPAPTPATATASVSPDESRASPHVTYSPQRAQHEQPSSSQPVAGAHPATGAEAAPQRPPSVSPYGSSRNDSTSPRPSEVSPPATAPQQQQTQQTTPQAPQPHQPEQVQHAQLSSSPPPRAPSPGGAALLRPAAPNRERSSPALEPGRVEGKEVQPVELEGSNGHGP